MSYSLKVKRIFLSFAQQLFASDPWLTWNIDPKTTEIIIGDKFFLSNPLIDYKPSIIITRGNLGWGMHSIGQMYSEDMIMGDTRYADLIHGSITYNIIHKDTQYAERLADYLFARIIGHKKQFNLNGITKLKSISMGEEIIIKGNNADIELTSVPIYIQYSLDEGFEYNYYEDVLLIKTDLTGNIDTATLGADFPVFGKSYLRENLDYTVSGNEIHFLTIPSGVELTINYTGNITLSSYSETADYTSGGSEYYYLQEPVQSWYYVFSGLELIVNASGQEISRIDL